MVVGNGLLAKEFNFYKCDKRVVIFASGVSNSKETNYFEFQREEQLLKKTMEDNIDKILVYFSTCSIDSLESKDSQYVKHKLEMEKLVKKHNSFYIFRLPQVVGITKSNTLIKYFVESIKNNIVLTINKYSTRNLISIKDVFLICKYIIDNGIYINETTNIASKNNISILKIVEAIECFTNCNTVVNIIDFGIPFKVDVSKIEKLNIKTEIFKSSYYLFVIEEYCKQMELSGN